MSDNKSKARPSHRIYFVLNEGTKYAQWLELGALFENKDGGYAVLLDRQPIGGFPETDRLRFVAQPVKSPPAE